MATNSNQVSNSDLPSWYQQYTKNLGQQAMGLAQGNNQQPLPQQGTVGFNDDQAAAFDQVRQNQGSWAQGMQNAADVNAQIPDTAAQFVDYAQGTVAGPAQTTSDGVMPWAQGAQDAVSGSAQSWVDPGTVQKYMSPYTTQVVDNIARLGKRNWEDTVMPGVNSAMLGSGQFGSTRNADILGRAGVNAANDITGQQSTALQAGYNSGAQIFGQDANRAQSQGQIQSNAALQGGNLMQGAMSADANRIQNQGQIQANTALTGASTATNAMNVASGNWGALAKATQALQNTDTQSLLNVGNQEQAQQQGAITTAYQNAMDARNDPWKQLNNAAGIINGMQLPHTTETSSSQTAGTPPSGLSSAAIAALTAAGLLNPDGSFK